MDEHRLLKACREGDANEVKLRLTNQKLNLNIFDGYLTSPLMWACKKGYLEIVDILLKDERVDPNMVINSGCNAFHYACLNGRTEIVKRMLKDFTLQINSRNNDGCTPLMLASQNGYIEIVKSMILSGRNLDISLKNYRDKRAIDLAIEYKKKDIVDLLMLFEMFPNETRRNLKLQEIGNFFFLFFKLFLFFNNSIQFNSIYSIY